MTMNYTLKEAKGTSLCLRSIPERLGFVEEGRIWQAEWLYDHFVDHVVYGVLAEEWEAKK